MIIAFALIENHPRSVINEHFGRCDWYGIYNTDTKESKFIENPNRYAEEGAGCTSAELLMQYNIQSIVAGRFGSRVVEFFNKNNIHMIIPDNMDKTMNDLIKLIQKS